MIRHWWAGMIVVGALGLTWSFVRGESNPHRLNDADRQAALMRAKLASTQKVVEGLVSKDFDTIARGADELLKICKTTEWEGHEDEIYKHHRKELVRQAEKIARAASRENLDGAAFAYIQSLTTCINCHDHCRDVLKIADRTAPLKVVPIPTTDEEIDLATPARNTRR